MNHDLGNYLFRRRRRPRVATFLAKVEPNGYENSRRKNSLYRVIETNYVHKRSNER